MRGRSQNGTLRPALRCYGAPMQPSVGPLAGIRIIELAGLGPAPYAAMLLAELGADVLRIDRPGAGGLILRPEDDVLQPQPAVAPQST